MHRDVIIYAYELQGRSQRGAGGGGSPPPDKVLAPLVGLGRYIESFQNKKIFNKNTLVQIKKFTSFPGTKPPDSYTLYTLEKVQMPKFAPVLQIAPKYKNLFQFYKTK